MYSEYVRERSVGDGGKDRGQYRQTPLIRLTVRKRKTNHARGEGQNEKSG